MQSIRDYKDLEAWKKSHELVLFTYKLTQRFPKYELFALCDQMRRASVSITSNLAEGFGRKYFKEKIQFWHLSRGSLLELDNQFCIARDLGYCTKYEYDSSQLLIVSSLKLLHRLISVTEFNAK